MKAMERKTKIDRYLKGIYNLSPKGSQPYFGKDPCECCGYAMGGLRHKFTGTMGKKHTADIKEFSCCIDCFEYLFV